MAGKTVTPIPPAHRPPPIPPWLVLLIILSASLFWLFYHTKEVSLSAGDSPAYLTRSLQNSLKTGFHDLWAVESWLGQQYGPISPDHNSLILSKIPFPFTLTVLFSFNLLLAGMGMYFLLRRLGLSAVACIFGGVSFALTNTVLTLVYPGHVHKILSFAWFPFSISFFLSAVEDRCLRQFALSGLFLGLSVLGGEIQMAYYLGLWYLVWLVCILFWRSDMRHLKPLTIVFLGLVFVAVCALVVGAQKTIYFYDLYKNTPPVVGSENSEDNWRFATQFFFPPEEVLSYITTGLFFGSPDVYWGRDGNPSPLRLSDDYMGLLPLALGILGAVTCWRIRQVRLFIIMGVGSLFISFGKNGLLYWILYHLPTMKSQRNPHRWSYFVSLAVCVLAAYGVQWLRNRLQSTVQEKKPSQEIFDSWKVWQKVLMGTCILGAVMVGVSLILNVRPETIVELVRGKAALASPMLETFKQQARLSINSILRTGYFLIISAGTLWIVIVITLKERVTRLGWKVYLPWAMVILCVILDLGLNAKRFIRFDNWRDIYEKNQLIEGLLKNDKDIYRIKVLDSQRNPLLNHLVSVLFPYHRIPVVDPPALSRIPSDYKNFFDYVQDRYMRSDRGNDYFNVKYLLSTQPLHDSFAGFAPIAQWNGIHIYRRDSYMPRAWLARKVYVANENQDAILFATLHPGRDFQNSVVLESPPEIPLPVETVYQSQLPPRRTPEEIGKEARITRLEDNLMEIETFSPDPAMLVIGEKWDPAWKAWMDGKPVPIRRANFLMRALEIPAGQHKVVMEYRPSQTGYHVTLVSAGILILIALLGAFRRFRGTLSS